MNPYISKFDADFDAGKSSQYRMAIQFSLGGLSYALLDTESRTLVGLECYQLDPMADSVEVFQFLERILEHKGLNDKRFQFVTCLIDDRVCTLVPTVLFEEKDVQSYLDFSFQLTNEQIILTDALTMEKCVNVFAISKTLLAKIRLKWPEAQLHHTSRVFIDSSMKYAPEGKAAFVNVRSRDFDMVIVNNGHLMFFNNFKFNTKADFAYFLLFAIEQNGFSGTELPVCFSGLIQNSSEIVELCSRYIKHLLFVEDQHELQVNPALEEVPYQYYYIHYQALK